MRCPICKQEVTDMKYRPFCSKCCADVDLGNWLVEKYVVEGNECGIAESENSDSDK